MTWLSAAALLAGCGGADAPDAPAGPAALFVTLITGKVAVLERATLAERTRIGGGHTATLGVAVMPGQNALYYGNRDTGALERLEVSADLNTATTVRSLPIDGPITGVVGAADGSLVAVTSQSEDAAKPDRVVFVRPSADTAIAGTLDVAGPATTRDCPCPRIGAAASGRTVVVSHMTGHTATLVDAATLATTRTVPLERADDIVEPWLGPSAFPAVSSDGLTAALPGLEARRVLLLAGDAEPAVYETPGELPFAVTFIDGDRALLVVALASVPVTAAEVSNAKIPTWLHRVELDGLHLTAHVQMGLSMDRVAAVPGTDEVIVGGSFATVAVYGTLGLDLRRSVNLSVMPMPVLGVDL